MMKTVSVAKIDDLTAAQALIEAEVNPRLNSEEARLISSLLCEELVLCLLHSGNTDVRVTVLSGTVPAYEIKSAGDLSDSPSRVEGDDADWMENFIRDSLLVKYKGYVDHRFRRGVHIYRVHPAREGGDLSEEIFSFYQSDKGRRPDAKPIAVLRYLAENHRLLVTLSILNKTIKHLCALMLPVFAANLIETLSACASFFERKVLLNILASALALTVNLICATLDARCYQRFTRRAESGFKLAIVQKLQVLSMRFYNDTPNGRSSRSWCPTCSLSSFCSMSICRQRST